jgi:REP element-mobilizing transposase RayT
MSRTARQAPAGFVYHALNRAVARLPLFERPADYDAFVRVLGEALDQCPSRLLAFVLMPNHWHLVLWPELEGELMQFCRWLAHTHSMQWHAHYHTSKAEEGDMLYSGFSGRTGTDHATYRWTSGCGQTGDTAVWSWNAI